MKLAMSAIGTKRTSISHAHMSAFGGKADMRFSPQRAPQRCYCTLSTPSLPQVSISWSCVKWHMLPDGGSARVASIVWKPTNHRQRTSAEAPRNIVFIFIESSSGSEEAVDACLDHIPVKPLCDLAHTSRFFLMLRRLPSIEQQATLQCLGLPLRVVGDDARQRFVDLIDVGTALDHLRAKCGPAETALGRAGVL